MPNQKKVFVFDADDTLWMNEWQYSQATAQFFNYLYTIFDGKIPNLHYIYQRYYAIDGKLFETWGVKRGRVVRSMLLIYTEIRTWSFERFQKTFSIAEDRKNREEIKRIGDTPFDYRKVKWLREAIDMLFELKRMDHTLCLLSSYDKKIFPHKAEYLGIAQFFDQKHIHITECKKTKEDFIAASGWTPENDASTKWYAVGNGESDIRPALELSENWHGIYIPHGSTSKYFEHDGMIDHFMPPPFTHPNVTTITSIEKLLKVI